MSPPPGCCEAAILKKEQLLAYSVNIWAGDAMSDEEESDEESGEESEEEETTEEEEWEEEEEFSEY